MLQTSTVTSIKRIRQNCHAAGSRRVERLVNSDAAEVLQFLAQRPIHTVAMMSLIHDNGIVSPFQPRHVLRLSRLERTARRCRTGGSCNVDGNSSIVRSPRCASRA